MGCKKSSRRISPGWMSGSLLPATTPVKSTRPASKSSRLMLMASSLVVVDDFHVPCRAFAPFEANPPLIVDADTLLSAPVTVQSFEAIARRQAQIVELFSGVDGEKLA